MLNYQLTEDNDIADGAFQPLDSWSVGILGSIAADPSYAFRKGTG